MKTTPSYVTITLDYDRKLVLTADQAAVVLKAINGAPIYRCQGYDGFWVATDETVKIETIAARMLLDEAPTTGE